MKLLVTGGAGFIGSNFIRYWLKKYPKDKITNLDKLTYAGHLSSTKDYSDNPRYKFVKGDICDPRLVDSLARDVDYLIHFAAESHVDRSILGSSVFVKTNTLGTQVLLDAAVRNKIKHFHHVSTDEVFGSLSLSSTEKFNESTPLDPHNPYSAAKAGSDLLAKSYFYTFGLPVTISNCSNNFGPFQDPEKFIPRQIIRFLNKQKATVYGDGKYCRDWLYVDDHIKAIELVFLHGKIGETYCVGGQKSKEYSNLEIINYILKVLSLDTSYIDFVKDRPGHDRRYAVDWSKINKELGWKPEYDFETYLEKTVKWYQENKWWWQPLVKRAESIYNSR